MTDMGRKSGISTSERRLRSEIAQKLSDAIGTERGAEARAARQLGISRQAMNLYLREKATPGSEILRRACLLYNLKLDVGWQTLDSGSFRNPKPQAAPPVQLTIFDAISEVVDRQLEVKVLRKGVHSIDLKVSIDFKKVRSVR
jgi:hypothetical protein